MALILIIIAVIAVIAISIVGIKLRSPKSKGKQGERLVAEILGVTIQGEQYIINDLLFKDGGGNTCQIDHIYINKYGIWVIETKNYGGKIYGQDNLREWTQVLANGNQINKFYNPVKQNTTHIYRLSEYLNVKDVFINVVVFSGRADIFNVCSDKVYSVYTLPSIKTKLTGIYIPPKKMDYCYKKLLELKNISKVTKGEHIENIHKMQAQIEQGICPRCGGNLVPRNGKSGLFYGCSNFPQCKFSKNID